MDVTGSIRQCNEQDRHDPDRRISLPLSRLNNTAVQNKSNRTLSFSGRLYLFAIVDMDGHSFLPRIHTYPPGIHHIISLDTSRQHAIIRSSYLGYMQITITISLEDSQINDTNTIIQSCCQTCNASWRGGNPPIFALHTRYLSLLHNKVIRCGME